MSDKAPLQQGRQAFLDGDPRNPYPWNSEDYSTWRKGFDQEYDAWVAQRFRQTVADYTNLLAICEAALADAEKAASPSARLFGYTEMKAAVKKVAGCGVEQR